MYAALPRWATYRTSTKYVVHYMEYFLVHTTYNVVRLIPFLSPDRWDYLVDHDLQVYSVHIPCSIVR